MSGDEVHSLEAPLVTLITCVGKPAFSTKPGASAPCFGAVHRVNSSATTRRRLRHSTAGTCENIKCVLRVRRVTVKGEGLKHEVAGIESTCDNIKCVLRVRRVSVKGEGLKQEVAGDCQAGGTTVDEGEGERNRAGFAQCILSFCQSMRAAKYKTRT
jgi:hypothetical protein